VKDCVAANIVLTNAPYPEEPHSSGDVIAGIGAAEACSGVSVLHAGTAYRADGKLIANSGRVLNVCAADDTLQKALNNAYYAASFIGWEHKAFRRDIGQRVTVLPKSEEVGGKMQSW
jgi:phosphoribosylamine--glycine ligase